jgi:hypothetical protein
VTWVRSSPSMNRFIDCSAQTRCFNLGDHLPSFNAFSHSLSLNRTLRLRQPELQRNSGHGALHSFQRLGLAADAESAFLAK